MIVHDRLPEGPHDTSTTRALSHTGTVAYGSRLAIRVRVRDEVTGLPVTRGSVFVCVETAVTEPCYELPLSATGTTRVPAVRATRQVRVVASFDYSAAYVGSDSRSIRLRAAPVVSGRLATGGHLVVRMAPAARTRVQLQRLGSGRCRVMARATTTARGGSVFSGLAARNSYRVVALPVAGRAGAASSTLQTP